MFDEINRRNLALFIHPTVPCGIEAMQDYDLAAAVGYLLDTCLAALRLVYSGTCERCPNLQPILCHAGGYLPFQWDRLDTSYQCATEARQRISRPPTDPSSASSTTTRTSSLRGCAEMTLETVGAGRFMLGSDYPFAVGDLDKAVQIIGALTSAPRHREAIESGNALSVLR